MKKNLLAIGLFLLAICQIQAENSALVSRVIDYSPAPGQHINRLFPPADKSDSHENAVAWAATQLVGKTNGLVGLGAFGGYIIVGFDHSIVNVAEEYDFKVYGNAFANGAEPGIVMVCQDLNGNGVPDNDEPWYELAGSDYHLSSTIKNYEITYTRPNPDLQKSHIQWTDNQGGSGQVTHISFASQSTMYPLWIADNTLTFRGTKLAGNAVQNGSYFTLPALSWGYADNQPNNSTNDKTSFNIDWAVDASGNPVQLSHIDFIKIYTAMVQEAGWLGETSTEIAGVEDLHPNASLPTVIHSQENKQMYIQNPFNETLIVKANENCEMILYTISGNLIGKYMITPGENTITTSQLPTGNYIVHIINTKQNHIYKLIKH